MLLHDLEKVLPKDKKSEAYKKKFAKTVDSEAEEVEELTEHQHQDSNEFHPGKFKIDRKKGADVKEKMEPDSKSLRRITNGSWVEIVQCVFLPEACRVRGQLAEGGWINLMDTASKTMFVV